MTDSNGLVQKLWNYCNVLRDDGLSYGDYLEQLTYLLFLKMADEQTKPPFNRAALVPADLDWQSLLRRDGDDLEAHYRHILTELGRRPGMLGVVFRKARTASRTRPSYSGSIVDLIDSENWMTLDADVKGDAYEGLLEKNAEDTKTGAGQYFTPRALIKAIVEVMRPEPGMTICDPACGTGGFLLAAHDYICQPLPARPRPEAPSSLRGPPRLGDRRQHRPPVRHEPAPARHRRRRTQTARSTSMTRSGPTPVTASRWSSRIRRSARSRR